MRCFTLKLYKKYKSRNKTKRHYQHFKHNLDKYLSHNEIRNIKCKNNWIKKKNINHLDQQIIQKIQQYNLSYKPKKVETITKQIKKHFKNKKTILFQNDEYSFYNIQYINKEYPIYCLIENNITYTLLDLNQYTKFSSYLKIGNIQLNYNRKLILFNIDFIGNRIYHFFIKSFFNDIFEELNLYNTKINILNVHQTLDMNIKQSNHFLWLDDNNFSYNIYNKSYNSSKLYIYNIDTKKSYLLYKNVNTFVEILNTHDGFYHILYDSDYNSDEIYLVDYKEKYYVSEVIFKRKFSVMYPFIEHYNGIWYLHIQNKNKDTICTTMDFKKFNTLYENNNEVEKINQVKLYKDCIYFILYTPNQHLVYKIYNNKLEVIPINTQNKIYYLDFGDFMCNKQYIYLNSNLYEHKINLRQITPVNQDKSPYKEKNIFIREMLYFTILYKNHIRKNSKCLMFGYGSYGDNSINEKFRCFIPLLDENYIIIFAHIRGGGEFGFKGYDEGRLLNKKNTFYDFIEIAHYLFKHNYTSRDKLVIWGRSAGGLLISCVLNIEPTICNLAILGVPFTTPIITMKNKHNPLGFESHSEFGNPYNKTHLKYIESYDPITNINKDANYPNIFIYTNLNDTLVPYKESIMYYEQMKKVNIFQQNKKEIQIFIDILFGHEQGTSQTDYMKSHARIIDMILQKN